MLHTPNIDRKGRAYCGPTAIAAVTGEPVTKIEKMIRRIRSDGERKRYGRILYGGGVKNRDGRRLPIRGMYTWEMKKVMKRLGYKPVGYGHHKNRNAPRTLREFCDDKGHLGVFIVEVTDHFVAVSRGMICDTMHKEPVPWQEYRKLSRRVVQWWRFNERKIDVERRREEPEVQDTLQEVQLVPAHDVRGDATL